MVKETVDTSQADSVPNEPGCEGWSQVLSKKAKATFAQALARKGKPKKGSGIGNNKPKLPSPKLPQTRQRHNSAPAGQQATARQTDNSRVVVSNACRVWGTIRSCTTSTIKNAISQLTNVGESINIRRKFKKDGNRLRWWFVIHAEETVLKSLDTQ